MCRTVISIPLSPTGYQGIGLIKDWVDKIKHHLVGFRRGVGEIGRSTMPSMKVFTSVVGVVLLVVDVAVVVVVVKLWWW